MFTAENFKKIQKFQKKFKNFKKKSKISKKIKNWEKKYFENTKLNYYGNALFLCTGTPTA